MSYACNYETIKNNKIIKSYKFEVCFSSIYTKIQEFDYIKLYIFKDYSLFDDRYSKNNHNLYFEYDIIKYTKILNKLPNDIKLNINDKYYDKPAYSFLISTKNELLCKIQLNCLRYLYESENWKENKNFRIFKDIPKTLIEINSKLKTLNILNKIILSHYISTSLDGGHDIVGCSIKKLYTKKEYLKLITENSNEISNVYNTLKTYGNFKINEKLKLSNLLKTDVKKGYIYYKLLLKIKNETK